MRSKLVLSVLLVAFSAAVYCLLFLLFKNPHQTIAYFLQDLAFLPVSVLLVTLILEGMISRNETRNRLQKLNMVVGIFFTETGIKSLKIISAFVTGPKKNLPDLRLIKDWSDLFIDSVVKEAVSLELKISLGNDQASTLSSLKSFFSQQRDFLLRLMENPNLLEHETFTVLLQACLHLTEELVSRETFSGIPDTDTEHLGKDILRFYRLLVKEWILYMKHLRRQYPFLYSFALRTNPFDPDMKINVME